MEWKMYSDTRLSRGIVLDPTSRGEGNKKVSFFFYHVRRLCPAISSPVKRTVRSLVSKALCRVNGLEQGSTLLDMPAACWRALTRHWKRKRREPGGLEVTVGLVSGLLLLDDCSRKSEVKSYG